MKYRKKPVVIEAVQFDGKNYKEISEFTGGVAYPMSMSQTLEPAMFIDTLEGCMTADCMDYIIKGVQGEFYPCKPDIFRLTYEREV